jgi:hypothetical protein
VEKDVRARLSARDAENVFNRPSVGWSQFSHHPELGFIDVEFLEKYREKRIRIVNKRNACTQEEGVVLSNASDVKEETVLDKTAIPAIQTLMSCRG